MIWPLVQCNLISWHPLQYFSFSHTGLLSVPEMHQLYSCLRAFAFAVPYAQNTLPSHNWPFLSVRSQLRCYLLREAFPNQSVTVPFAHSHSLSRHPAFILHSTCHNLKWSCLCTLYLFPSNKSKLQDCVHIITISQLLESSLAYMRCFINSCQMNEWMNEWILFGECWLFIQVSLRVEMGNKDLDMWD